MNKITKNKITIAFGLAGWMALVYLVAWIAAQFSPGIAPADWYNSINKPSWNPPSWVFGPVWSTLYTLMAISAWIVWKDYGFRNAGTTLFIFLTQLLLNGLWSIIFFGMNSLSGALIEILILLVFISLTIRAFHTKSKTAAWLMVPYFCWVAFATVLTLAIYLLN